MRLYIIFPLFNFRLLYHLLLLHLIFLEIKRYYRWQLQRIPHSYQLPAVEPRYWQQTLWLHHLTALVQYDYFELHPFEHLESRGCTSGSNYTFLRKFLDSLLEGLFTDILDTRIEGHQLFILRAGHLTVTDRGSKFNFHGFQITKGVLVCLFFVGGGVVGVGEQGFVDFFEGTHTGEVFKLGVLQHHQDSIDCDVSQGAYQNLDICVAYLI